MLREYTFFFGLFILSANVNCWISSYLLHIRVLRAVSIRRSFATRVKKLLMSPTVVISDVIDSNVMQNTNYILVSDIGFLQCLMFGFSLTLKITLYRLISLICVKWTMNSWSFVNRGPIIFSSMGISLLQFVHCMDL